MYEILKSDHIDVEGGISKIKEIPGVNIEEARKIMKVVAEH